jgi:glycine cleavage system H protein
MMQIPKNIYYTKEHLWLQKIGLYDFYVGITDFGQKEIGEIDLIELTYKASLLKKGSLWGIVYGTNDTFHLIAPFDCEIIEKNRDLHKHTAYVNTAPYNYWFAIITTKIDTVSLLTFQDYKQLTQ